MCDSIPLVQMILVDMCKKARESGTRSGGQAAGVIRGVHVRWVIICWSRHTHQTFPPTAIKSIKLFSWEGIVAERVDNARDAELSALGRGKHHTRTFSPQFLYFSLRQDQLHHFCILVSLNLQHCGMWLILFNSSSLAPALASAASFLTLTVIQHHELDPPIAFTTIVLVSVQGSSLQGNPPMTSRFIVWNVGSPISWVIL